MARARQGRKPYRAGGHSLAVGRCKHRIGDGTPGETAMKGIVRSKPGL